MLKALLVSTVILNGGQATLTDNMQYDSMDLCIASLELGGAATQFFGYDHVGGGYAPEPDNLTYRVYHNSEMNNTVYQSCRDIVVPVPLEENV